MEASLTSLQHTHQQAVSPLAEDDRAWFRLSFPSFLGIAFVSMLIWGVWYWKANASYGPYLYLCVVLFGSLRYGAHAGLLVAVLAIGIQGSMRYAMGGAGSLTYEQVGPVSVVCLLIAIVAGEIADGRRRRDARAVAHVGEMTETVRSLSARYASATEVISELERRVADQSVTVTTLDDVARRLEAFDVGEIYPAVVDILRLCLPAEAASVYALQTGHLVAKAHVPALQTAPPGDLMASDPLVRQVLATGKACHIRDLVAEDPACHQRQACVLMAAPLLGPSGVVVGVVTVERMPFISCNPSAVRLFETIAAWSSRSLRNALLFANCATKADPEELTPVLSFPQTMRRVWQEMGRARRHHHSLSVLVVRVHTNAQLPPPEEAEWFRMIADTLCGAMRTDDIIGRHRLPDNFIAVLPETSPQAARVVAERLGRAVRAVGDQSPVTGHALSIAYGIAGLTPETPSTASLLAAADAGVRAAIARSAAEWSVG
jgi:GGDEF domain-containing protein